MLSALAQCIATSRIDMYRKRPKDDEGEDDDDDEKNTKSCRCCYGYCSAPAERENAKMRFLARARATTRVFLGAHASARTGTNCAILISRLRSRLFNRLSIMRSFRRSAIRIALIARNNPPVRVCSANRCAARFKCHRHFSSSSFVTPRARCAPRDMLIDVEAR